MRLGLLTTIDTVDGGGGGSAPSVMYQVDPVVNNSIAPASSVQTSQVAQQQFQYTGQVVDATSGSPVPYASVVLTYQGVQVGAAAADVNGDYNIITTGEADTVSASSTGYTADSWPTGTQYPQTLQLSKDVTLLPGVTVTAGPAGPSTTSATNYSWLFLLLVPMLIKDQKKKKVGDVTPDKVKEWLPIAAIAAAVIIFWKPLSSLFKLANGILNAPFAIANFISTGLGQMAIPPGTIDEFHTMFNICKVSPDTQEMEDLVNSNPRFSDLQKANLIGQLKAPKTGLGKIIAAAAASIEIDKANTVMNNAGNGVDLLLTGATSVAAGLSTSAAAQAALDIWQGN